MDKIATDKQTQHRDDSLKRNIRLFTEELNVNLRSAYSQLGYDTSAYTRMPEANVYKMEITAVGWYNVDRYVVESTITRTTLNYRDSTTNKAATIKYQPVSIQIKKPEQYDGVDVYLLPDKLNSFIRLPKWMGNTRKN